MPSKVVKNRYKRFPPGLFPRVTAFIIDWSLGLFIFSILHSFPKYRQLVNEGINFLGLSSLFNQGFFQDWIEIFFITSSLRFYSGIFLSLTIGEFLASITSKGDWFWKRVSGGLRGAYFPILFISFPIDYFLIKHKGRSTSEILTFTKFRVKKSHIALIGRVVFIVSFSSLLMIAPLFENLALVDGIQVDFKELPAEKINKKDTFQNYSIYSSETFGFKTVSDLKSGRFLLLPQFHIKKKGKQTKINPYFSVYDQKNKEMGRYEVIKRISFRKLLHNVKKRDPLFYKKFPKISKALKTITKRKDYELVIDKSKLWNKEVREEVRELLKTSFSLGVDNIVSHFMSNGPFIRGYLLLRNSLLKQVRINEKVNVDIIRLGKEDFFRFLVGDKKILMPIESEYSFLLSTGWSGESDSQVEFEETFLSNSEWLFDYKEISPWPEFADQITVFNVIDVYANWALGERKRDKLETYLYKFYMDLGRKVFLNGDEDLKDKVISNINELKYLNDVRLVKQSKRESEFSEELLKIKNALYLENRDFFNSNTKDSN